MLFAAAVLGQSLAGHRSYNEEQLAHEEPTISYERYLVSSDFGQALMENWQSEYLQFALFIVATIWLVQRGSNESKRPEDAGRESDARQLIGEHAQRNSPLWAKVGGWRTALYSNSLLLVMALIFFGSWFGQSVTGWTEYNDRQRAHDESTVSWLGYVARPEFWELDVPELAVRVPRRRDSGCLHHLPAAARVAGIEAGRSSAQPDGDLRLARPGVSL